MISLQIIAKFGAFLPHTNIHMPYRQSVLLTMYFKENYIGSPVYYFLLHFYCRIKQSIQVFINDRSILMIIGANRKKFQTSRYHQLVSLRDNKYLQVLQPNQHLSESVLYE